MALKPTIFKLRIDVCDIDRGYYETLNLTVAQHPSETAERMMVRVLVYCLNAQEGLSFGKGVSSPDEADVWSQSLDGQIPLWIDVGEPSAERIKKASNLADAVKVYCFNSKSDVWWQQSREKLSRLNVTVQQFPWHQIQQLATFVERTMTLSITITGDSAYVAGEQGECEIICTNLQSP